MSEPEKWQFSLLGLVRIPTFSPVCVSHKELVLDLFINVCCFGMFWYMFQSGQLVAGGVVEEAKQVQYALITCLSISLLV